VGTSSFWEGVDVRGTALRLVIIDKLPFSSPGDPVLQARLEALREQGDDPFRGYQLPQAVITLKQGAGRLIRDAGDRGVLMLCDPRLLSRPYGKTFINSLPPMPVSHDLQQACSFFQQQAAA
jgi:ATP-dependent DNA helicase DinG